VKEFHMEGLAPHRGSESCVGVREGVGEALTGGVQAGLWSREINEIGVPTLLTWRKAISLTALCASRQRTPRGLRTRACTQGSMRENREGPCPPVQLITGWAVRGTLRRYA
jgi:hypothetical protein